MRSIGVAAAFVETEKHYRRIVGCQQLGMLKATLDEPREDQHAEEQRRTG